MTMYALKPIVSLPRTMQHRKTMYEMRNIHERREERTAEKHTETESKIVPDITEQTHSCLFEKQQNFFHRSNTPLAEYNVLEERQEKILAQLAELKQQVSTLSNILKQTSQVTDDKIPKSQESVNVNLIINANPKRPPYSICALQKVWKDTEFKIKTYVHSSVNEEGFIVYHSTDSTRNNIVNLSLIWKDVEDLEVVSGLHGYFITGEVNFLRYLSRLINSHNYEDSVCLEKINTTDFILDLCHSSYYEKSSNRQQEILSTIADKLNVDCSDRKPGIADIAAWCVIKQVSPKKCPPRLDKWFKACDKLFT